MLGFGLLQHIVEFKPGIGVVTDGAIDPTSLNGPWTWVVPQGFLGQPRVDACNGGGGGSGGAILVASGINAGAGGGGGTAGVIGYECLSMAEGESITVTVGAAGTGGAAGAAGTGGGQTSVTCPNYVSGDLTRSLVLPAQYGAGSQPTSLTTGASVGGQGGSFLYYGQGAAGAASGAGDGGEGNLAITTFAFATYYQAGGGGGGGGNATGTTSGGNGGGVILVALIGMVEALASGGGTSGSVSYGGGGTGADSLFGTGGHGGNGTGTTWAPYTGGNGTGFGAAGGGGGGNNAGGNGTPGYVRITYWSME